MTSASPPTLSTRRRRAARDVRAAGQAHGRSGGAADRLGARRVPGSPALPHALLGHSAGGQFLSRVAAFAPTDATHIVIANPSTWVLPSLDDAVPYGFGGTPEPEAGPARLSRAADHGAARLRRHRHAQSFLGARSGGARRQPPRARPQHLRQGQGRRTRARLARSAGSMLEVPGVGHNAARDVRLGPGGEASSDNE